MNKINQNQKLGEIVSIFPKSEKIFNQYKIDFCCGGHDTLIQAVNAAGLSIDTILNELNEAYELFIQSKEDFKDWRKETPTALIDHILDTHHDFERQELKDLDFLVNKILKVHFEHHSEELLKLHRLFSMLKMELEEHFVKEEENLFPLIEEYEITKDEETYNKIKHFVIETEAEHDDAGELLKEIAKLTNDYQPPVGVCNTYRLVYTKLNGLEKDIFRHIYLENSVLFEMLNLNLH